MAPGTEWWQSAPMRDSIYTVVEARGFGFFVVATSMLAVGVCSSGCGGSPSAKSASDSASREVSSVGFGPNGRIKLCDVQRNVKDDGRDVLQVQVADPPMQFSLPEASDWRLQCDKQELFFAMSKSLRVQVTVEPSGMHWSEDDQAHAERFLSSARERYASVDVHITGSGVIPLAADKWPTRPAAWFMQLAQAADDKDPSPEFPQDHLWSGRMISARGERYYMHFTYFPAVQTQKPAQWQPLIAAMQSFLRHRDNPDPLASARK